MRSVLFSLLALISLASQSEPQAPVFAITPEDSTIRFYVKSSARLAGTFDKWDATIVYASRDVTRGALDIKIQASSVNTGSRIKDDKLKSKDFFDVSQNPLITFVSRKIVQTGPESLEVQGDFTIRGVTKPVTLTLTVYGNGTGSGTVRGTMAFDRREFGMNSNVPFIKIADRVEVSVNLKVKRVSGPPLIFSK
jgi:polyisoprenoid-binding protein YceI